MAIKASSTITLSFMVDVKAVYRYYKLQSSTLSAPSVPTTNPPSGWVQAEPTYTSGSTNTLYTVDLTVFTNDTWLYTPVSKSSSYEAAKDAYNKAVSAQGAANSAQDTANTANDKIDNLQVGGRNIFVNSDFSKQETTAAQWDNNLNGTLSATSWSGYNAGVPNPTTGYHAHVNNGIFGYPVFRFVNDGSSRWLGTSQTFTQQQKDCIIPGKQYVFSCDVYTDTQGMYISGGMYSMKKGGTTYSFSSGQYTLKPTKSGVWERLSYTFTADAEMDSKKGISFYVYGYKSNIVGSIFVKNLQLQLGNKSTDWDKSIFDIQSQIDTSKQMLDDIASDSKLTPSEKQEVKREWLDIATEYSKYTTQCTTYNVSLTAYKNAYDALNSYLNTTNSGVIFNMNSTTDINRDTFNNKFATYYSCKVDMLNALEYAKAKKEADNIQIGGRNLLMHTDIDKYGVGYWVINSDENTLSVAPAENNYRGKRVLKITGNTGIVSSKWYQLDKDTVYTYSMMIYTETALGMNYSEPLHMWVNTICDAGHLENIIATSHTNIPAGKFVKIWITFKTPDATNRYFFRPFVYRINRTCYICEPKLEKGNRATDWQPSPEDTQTEIDTSKKLLDDIASDSKLTPSEKQEVKREWLDIDTEYNKYKLQCTNYNVSYDAYKNAYDALNSYLNATNSGVIFNVNTTTDISRETFNNKFSTYYSCKVDMLNALEYAKAKKEADNVQVGGRNLLLATDGEWDFATGTATRHLWDTNFNSPSDFVYNQTDEKGGNSAVKLTNVGNSWYAPSSTLNNVFKTAGTYTFSLWLRADGNTTVDICTRHVDDNNFISHNYTNITTEWRRYSVTVTAETPVVGKHNVFIFGNNSPHAIYTSHWQVEKGNKVTDWTPAPEDVQAGIDGAQSTANTAQSSADKAQASADKAQSSANDALSTATAAQTSANGKNTVFYLDGKNNSSGKPTVVPTGTTACPLKTNDLWFNTGEDNCSYRWNGSQWERKAYGNAAIDTLDAGKITTGQMDAARISVTDLSAFGATIGGFSIKDGAVYSTRVGMGRYGKEWAFWAGSDTSSEAPFRVGHAGELVATNATISGNVDSKTGWIGGFKIEDGQIISTNVGMGRNSKPYAFWAGSDNSSNAPFRVNHAGKMWATNADISGNIDSKTGWIGGFKIEDGQVTSTNVGMARNSKPYAFWAGNDTSSKAPFRVGHDGKVWATNAVITGDISGSTITGSTITSTDGNGIIKLANTALTFGAVGEDEEQIKIYLDNRGQAAIKTPWFKSAKNMDYEMYFSSASFTDITWTGRMYGTAYFNNNVCMYGNTLYVGNQTVGEKNIIFDNTPASSGTTNRADHYCKLYGGNANSTTTIGLFDIKNTIGVLIYQDGAQPNGTVSTTKKLAVASSVTFTATGTVSSSDERLKHDFKPLDRYEGFFYDLKPCSFKYDNGSSERDWIGAKAQDVEKALIKNGLTTKDFAGYIQYSKTEADDDWNGYEDERGLRYENFIFLNTYMIQKQHNEQVVLKEEQVVLKEEQVVLKEENEALRAEMDEMREEIDELKQLVGQLLDR